MAMTQKQPLISDGRTDRPQSDPSRVELLTKLALGLGLESVDQLLIKLAQWEAEIADGTDVEGGSAEELTHEKLRYLLIGALFEGQRKTRKHVGRASRIAGNVAVAVRDSWWIQAGESLLGDRLDGVNRLIMEGRLQEQNARRLTQRMVGGTIDDILYYLTDNEKVDSLVNSQVDQLQANPHVQNLSQDIVENFIDNPETIRKLVSDQGFGLTSELAEEVRERSVTLDMLGETIVRRLLRRPPRESLEEPPPAVKSRARYVHNDDLLSEPPESS